MKSKINIVKTILLENVKVLYGIFGVIKTSGYFPPRNFFNEFLIQGSDPCDQDGRMEKWIPFTLNEEEYIIIKDWWVDLYPNTNVDALNQNSWREWVQVILDLD